MYSTFLFKTQIDLGLKKRALFLFLKLFFVLKRCRNIFQSSFNEKIFHMEVYQLVIILLFPYVWSYINIPSICTLHWFSARNSLAISQNCFLSTLMSKPRSTSLLRRLPAFVFLADTWPSIAITSCSEKRMVYVKNDWT